MTTSPAAAEFDARNWGVERVRLTFFPRQGFDSSRRDWWERLMGAPPEQSAQQPREHVWSDEGAWSHDQDIGGSLVLLVKEHRIDWVLGFAARSLAEAEQWPATAGSAGRALDVFLKRMRQWLSEADIPAPQRLAVGLVALQRVPDKAAGYKLAGAGLPFDLDPQASDFSYTINRPRLSTVDAQLGIINRINKWGVLRFQGMELRLSGEGAEVRRDDEPAFAVRLELDLSTQADLESLPADRLGEILDSLHDQANELLEHGDIP